MWKDKIAETVTTKKDAYISLLQRIIDVPSVTGEEGAAQQEVRAVFEEMGLAVDCWEPDDQELAAHPAYVPTGESFQGRPCVVGTWKGTGGGKSVLVNGHIDVVTPEPLSKWSSDPFRSVIREGKLYGRGAADMKGGLCAAIAAVQVLQEIGFQPAGDILLESVPAEENGGNGTVAAVARGYTADAAIYPEPTGCQLQPAHRGAAFWRIHIDGIASHGGTKYKGVSAVEKGMAIAAALSELEQWRNDTICSKHPLYAGYPLSAPVTLGIFQGGQFTSATPEYCMLEGCIEFVPGEKHEDVVAQLEGAVQSVVDKDPFLQAHPPRVEWFGLLYDPAETETSHPFVQNMMRSYQAVTGQAPTVNGFEAGTDMRTLRNYLGVPGLMFGPGELKMAHAPNEYVFIEEYLTAIQVIALAIADWCGNSDTGKES